jgi:hypothetical protein
MLHEISFQYININSINPVERRKIQLVIFGSNSNGTHKRLVDVVGVYIGLQVELSVPNSFFKQSM